LDERAFNQACQLWQDGKLLEAFQSFSRLADDTVDQIDKAAVILHAARTLKSLERYDEASAQLGAARSIVAEYLGPQPAADDRLSHLEIYLDYEDAHLAWLQGKSEEALDRFECALERYRNRLHEPDFTGFYELMQTQCAFTLVDLGRWREAIPILEQAQEYTEYKAGIAFYLGHCYVSAQKYAKAKSKLLEALGLGLPPHLEYRAHHALGAAYYALGGFAQAKLEFEKAVETAEPGYFKGVEIWKMLEISCRKLRLMEDAKRYAKMAKAANTF
jgi:tetratricopeptide (TPR) repeat protein